MNSGVMVTALPVRHSVRVPAVACPVSAAKAPEKHLGGPLSCPRARDWGASPSVLVWWTTFDNLCAVLGRADGLHDHLYPWKDLIFSDDAPFYGSELCGWRTRRSGQPPPRNLPAARLQAFAWRSGSLSQDPLMAPLSTAPQRGRCCELSKGMRLDGVVAE